jgi:MoaD family protein
MNVEVLLFGRLRELAGASEESFRPDEGACLEDLFGLLGARHGPSLARELASPERFMILVNGRHYTSLNGLQTALKQGDTVAIVPAVIGG